MQARAGEPPVGEQLGRRGRGKFIGARLDEADRVGRSGFQQSGERRLVGDRRQRGAVGPQQVPDLVRDGPTLSGRRRGPAILGKRRDQRIELVAFGAQVGHDLLHGGH